LNRYSAIVTVRTSSSRLADKCLLPFGKSGTVLDFVISRAISGGFIPIICTSTATSDTRLNFYAEKYAIPIYFGDLEDKLNRWHNCFEALGLENAHLLDADDPFFDPLECMASYNKLVNEDWDMVRTSRYSDGGAAVVGTSVSFTYLNSLHIRSRNLLSRNFDVIPWELLIKPDDRVCTMPDQKEFAPGTLPPRLTLDYPEDYSMLNRLALEFPPQTPRAVVDSFLALNPEILQINLKRGDDFRENQLRQKKKYFDI